MFSWKQNLNDWISMNYEWNELVYIYSKIMYKISTHIQNYNSTKSWGETTDLTPKSYNRLIEIKYVNIKKENNYNYLGITKLSDPIQCSIIIIINIYYNNITRFISLSIFSIFSCYIVSPKKAYISQLLKAKCMVNSLSVR